MNRNILLAALLLPALLSAHFTFVVPHAGGQGADLIISEDLYPDPAVNPKLIEQTKLWVRNAEGKDTPLVLQSGKDRLPMQVPGAGNRIIFGQSNLGISPAARGPKEYLLMYYPKTVMGALWGEAATLGNTQVVELVPYGEAGAARIRLLVRGEAKPNAEMTVVLPGGEQKRVKTDAEGFAGPFAETGRFAVWARFWEDATGEHQGKRYEQIRHYGMLVFDAPRKPALSQAMPEATSSFGAALLGDALYVYGGHIANTHNYSTAAVSGQFHRWNFSAQQWEKLPGGPGLQGMNLVAHAGRIYRIGGMAPHNAPGEKADTRSTTDCAWFDPATKEWHSLPALPEPRSSHDVVAVGDRLYVVGGWNLRGAGGGPSVWAKTMLTLDLKAASPKWETHAQPFERRALIATVLQDKVYVLGGIQPSGGVSQEVEVFDTATQTWTKGPRIPGTAIHSFAPAAAVAQDKLFLSLGDGSLLQLQEKAGRWEDAGKTSPRLAHRMVASKDALIILGGAIKGKNLDLVETLPIPLL
ncbi:MAG: kelch repeat-containing protein [Bryobacter sp.]|nr:kelch repeat-containing protein [Bryobacter sp.]